MLRAFNRDFDRNGPSTIRIIRTTLAGWKRYKNHPNARIRRRYAFEVKSLPTSWAAAVKACQIYYRDNPALHRQMTELLAEIYAECGWKARLAAELGGRWLLRQVRKEEKRLAQGWTYEPPTFYDRNPAVADNPGAQLCQWAEPREAATAARA